jgi:hypoxanthine phosphoribosyltransferase
VAELGALAAEGVGPQGLTLVPVMSGAVVFTADLVRRLPVRLRVHPVSASSYPGRSVRSVGAVELRGLDALPQDLSGHDVLVVDDILDTGRTLARVLEAVRARGPRRLRSCVLLRKRRASPPLVEADLVGFEAPDEFVVGYGLDYDGWHRDLPDVAALASPIEGAEALEREAVR